MIAIIEVVNKFLFLFYVTSENYDHLQFVGQIKFKQKQEKKIPHGRSVGKYNTKS